ncbi:MAG: hypothetical protein J1E16_06450 [Muribaculaceae bacterium]|nr:hypothetical protein [Muribaculaceae bacterium]
MKLRELLQTEISFYGKVRYNKAYKRITLLDWITTYANKNKDMVLTCRSLYDTNKETYKTLKTQNLPAVTICGIFDNYRNMNQITKQNNILAIDIDGKDNEGIEDWDKIKKEVFRIKGVFFSSLSVSGKGIFVLVHYDTELDFNKVYNSLTNDFKELGLVIDKNCKDLTRLRFVSYDDNAITYNDREKDIEPYNKELEQTININKIPSTYNEDDEFTYKCIYHLIKECKYRANKYEDWLQDAFRLATLGEIGFVLFMYLSQVSDNYNEYDAKLKWNEAVKTTRYDKSCLVYYLGKLKSIYGEGKWKEVIK